MNKCQRGLLPAVLAISSFSGFAQSADLGPYDRRPDWRSPQPAYYPQAFRWSGFYAGIQAGYGWGNTDAVSTSVGGVQQSFSYSTTGAIGGVHAGYNWQVNSIVFGVETDLEASGMNGSGVGTLGAGHVTNIDWLGSFRGRLGFTTGNTLFYTTGGLAYGGISVDRSFGAGFTPFTGASDWKTGWTLGAGIEHAFSPNITARIEYRYTDLGRFDYTSSAAGFTNSSDITSSAVRAGLSFKF